MNSLNKALQIIQTHMSPQCPHVTYDIPKKDMAELQIIVTRLEAMGYDINQIESDGVVDSIEVSKKGWNSQ